MKWVISPSLMVILLGLLIASTGCQRSQSTSKQPPTEPAQTVQVPPDLQETVDKFVQAVEAFDVPHVLDVYADDFTSGTGRHKDEVRQVLTQLQASHVTLKVENAEVEKAETTEARLKTRLRLRYRDRFRDLGEGDVIVTDILVHKLRKDVGNWKIYADERVATYREGRYGNRPPNVQLEVPKELPTAPQYPVKVQVQRQEDIEYQVMLGNYAEDPAILPPPDIVTALPDDGMLNAKLLRNPQGRSEMVRITVIAADPTGQWVGATTVSKFVPGAQRQTPDEEEQKLV
jgi:hypothetical protein